MWDANTYLKFADERGRPFADLLGQVADDQPRTIVDLGCGPGQLTLTVAERWPAAQVIGVDNSPEMMEKARPLSLPGRLQFIQADIGNWSPEAPVDLVVSNAALHWLPAHDSVLSRLSAMLTPGGTLAVQMPNRFHTPAQAAIEETVAQPRWAALHDVGLHRESVLPLRRYVERLHELSFQVNAWETTYIHVLRGENPVLEWLRGTALRPLLASLELRAQDEFLRELAERLRTAYPPKPGVTLFPFPRLFFVATRSA
jgi:trans-aconitate 2-methyltransferase